MISVISIILRDTMVLTAYHLFGRQSHMIVHASLSDGLRSLKLKQVHVVHRHGDRTPITPLVDEDFWRSQLIANETIKKIGSVTVVTRDTDTPRNKHGAKGRGPFGKLTRLGLLQMIQLGTNLRERLSAKHENGHDSLLSLWSPSKPLRACDIRVISTDFERTIQSVQGLLLGLIPDGSDDNHVIPIDTRYTNIMIPDPLPRQTQEQAELEKKISKLSEVMERETKMRPLAFRVSQSIHSLLAPDAREVQFGVESEISTDEPSEEEIEVQPLSWNQLAEICNCLTVYDRLPSGLSKADVDAVLDYAASRWFFILRNPRLSYLATNSLVAKQLDYLCNSTAQDPCLTIWSAHDSTIVGLMCAYRLYKCGELTAADGGQNDSWPDYASYLMLELFQDAVSSEEYVRFSLNGKLLCINWEGCAELPGIISVSKLVENINIASLASTKKFR